MMAPSKSHTFGNEWHKICCVLSGLIFNIDIVEGKDDPRKREGTYHSY